MKRWNLWAPVAGILILSGWMGCSNPNLAGGKLHFDQASRLEGADRTARFERALETFKVAVNQMPQSGEAREWLAKTYAELDQPDSAGMNFDRALQLDPSLKSTVETDRGHYWSTKYNAGLIAAKSAVTARNQGNATTAQKSFREALRDFDKAVSYSPDRAETYTMIGKIYLNLAAVDSAITMLQKARTIAPNDAKVTEDLFEVYRTEADTSYQKGSTKLDVQDSTSARTLFENAAKLYRKAEETSPGHSEVAFQLGMTTYQLSQLDRQHQKELMDESVQHYQDVLKENPADVDVVYNLTLVLRDLDRTQEARDYAARLVDLKPREGSYRQILGRLEDKLGNKQALLNGIVFGTALKNGTKVDVADARSRAEKFGAGADVRKRYLENGPPDEILTFTDSQGQGYDVWFYWSRGQGYGFVQGKERFISQFAPDGVLTLSKSDLSAKGLSKEVTGTVTNASNHKYSYVRAEFTLLNDQDVEVGRVSAGTDALGPRGSWNFEIPLDKSQEGATKIRPEEILGY